ncbi:hypothetical protein [Marinoscillum sp. 108]|jgi:anti-sigma factor RsiW|uniref:Anti-sigma factor n=1 Tax=Marinoscillum luteum TaxID=861051 RepID=A0ABW7N946_9BACT|nr:hypothetical protein [Marinoscillum sp. 108]VXD18547.1 conserved hypothetical protein [Marinoscillum sp. 108]
MIKTFTENDLVRFLYDELNENEREVLEKALLTDSHLRSELDKLQAVKKDLGKVSFSPSKSSVDKILNFSKGYHKQSV